MIFFNLWALRDRCDTPYRAILFEGGLHSSKMVRYPPPLWEGKTGSICHFAFSLVLQCLGVPRYPDAWKNSTKSVTVTPLFVCPKC